MCDNMVELKDKLAEITAGSTVANTGWYTKKHSSGFGNGENQYHHFRFLSESRVDVARIVVTGNQDRYNFNGHSEPAKQLTLEELRGVLVTVMSVAETDTSRAIAACFAKVIDHLATQCFRVSRLDIELTGGDAEVKFELSNGFMQVEFTLRSCVDKHAGLTLDLGEEYILSRGFINKLIGKEGRWGGSSGISVRGTDGGWTPFMNVSSWVVRDDEKQSGIVTKEQFEAICPIVIDAKGLETFHRRLAGVQKLLRTLVGEVAMTELRVNQHQNDSARTLIVKYQNAKTIFQFEFRNDLPVGSKKS